MRKIIPLVFGVMTVVPVMGDYDPIIGNFPARISKKIDVTWLNEGASVIGSLADLLAVEGVDARTYTGRVSLMLPAYIKDFMRFKLHMKEPSFASASLLAPLLASLANFGITGRQQLQAQAITAYLGSLKEGSVGRNRINKYKKMLRISILARLVLKLILGNETLAKKYTNPMLFGRIFESLWRTAEIAGMIAAKRRVVKDALEYEAKFNAQEAGPVAGEVVDEDDEEEESDSDE